MPTNLARVEARPRHGRLRAQDVDGHVGARIRERRIALGLSQQRLAALVGITYQQQHKYEAGANRVSAGRLHAIARALGVGPGYFFEGLDTGGPPRPPERQRQLLELARSFAVLPRPQQEALCGLARVLAGEEAAVDGRVGPDDPGRELAAVTDAVRAAVARPLCEGGASPRLVARLLARVAGELGAAIASEAGLALDGVLDGLVDAMRQAGQGCHDASRLPTVLAFGSA